MGWTWAETTTMTTSQSNRSNALPEIPVDKGTLVLPDLERLSQTLAQLAECKDQDADEFLEELEPSPGSNSARNHRIIDRVRTSVLACSLLASTGVLGCGPGGLSADEFGSDEVTSTSERGSLDDASDAEDSSSDSSGSTYASSDSSDSSGSTSTDGDSDSSGSTDGDSGEVDLPSDSESRGLTWLVHLTDPVLDVILIGSDALSNPYSGDTLCTEARPIACLDRLPLLTNPGIPEGDYYLGWSGGIVALTSPIVGTELTSLAAANLVCAEQLGADYQMAEHHDGGGGWNWWAHGDLDQLTRESGRFWVHIDDQPGNCWD